MFEKRGVKMDIVEFAEKICGYELPLWQRELLRRVDQLPPDSKLVYCGGKWHIIKQDELPENSRPLCYGKGYNARIYIFDEGV